MYQFVEHWLATIIWCIWVIEKNYTGNERTYTMKTYTYSLIFISLASWDAIDVKTSFFFSLIIIFMLYLTSFKNRNTKINTTGVKCGQL